MAMVIPIALALLVLLVLLGFLGRLLDPSLKRLLPIAATAPVTFGAPGTPPASQPGSEPPSTPPGNQSGM